MASSVQEPIFINTSMGTRIAVAVSPNTTIGDFKREFERAHFNCFPNMGEIKVYALKVKQKSCFYHLPNSVPIRYAFQGVNGTWFLYVEASSSVAFDRLRLPQHVVAQARDCVSTGNSSADSMESTPSSKKKRNTKKKQRLKRFRLVKAMLRASLTTQLSKMIFKKLKRKRSKMRLKKNHFSECRRIRSKEVCVGINKESPGYTSQKMFGVFASRSEGEPKEEYGNCPLVETPSTSSTHVISVTSIIKRYFSNANDMSQSSSDVTSKAIENQLEEQLKAKTDDMCSNIRVRAVAANSAFTAKTPQRVLPVLDMRQSPGTLKDKIKSCEVGKRLLTASNSLHVYASKQSPSISIRRCNHGRSLGFPTRNLVFELSDTED